MTAVEVLAIRPLSNGGNLKAFASVRLGDVTVHDFRIIQQRGQKPWVSPPQREYVKDGQKKYVVIVELSDSVKQQVTAAVLREWEKREDR